MSDIYLVGTVHYDFFGYERLTKLLDHLEPDIITVETTEDNKKDQFDYLDKFTEFYKQLAQDPNSLSSLERTPEFLFEVELELNSFQNNDFELFVPWEYQKINSGFVVGIDNGVNDILELMKIKNFEYVINNINNPNRKKSIQEIVNEGPTPENIALLDHAYAHSLYTDLLETIGDELLDLALTKRDRLFAERIHKIYSENPGKRIVTILGNQHIFGDQKNSAYSLLQHLNPERIKLKEADQL